MGAAGHERIRGGKDQPQPFTPEAILARLRGRGMRVTAGRRRILDVLFSAKKPLSLVEIQRAATGADGRGPDYATVFRTLDLLEEMWVVHKVNLQRPCSYFEIQNPACHYDHIVCTACGKVVLISEPCPLHDFEETLARKHGFRGLTHSLEFFGRCARCAGKS
jgi:Fur family transcriptional regulator, ferric uptake regulator